MKILFVASELTPIAKVGGLGDVIGGLPKALEKLGVEVKIIIGKYGCIDQKKYLLQKISDQQMEWDQKSEDFAIYKTILPQSQIEVFMIDNPTIMGQDIYSSATAFTQSFSEIEKFSFLSKAALTTIKDLNWHPDVIHIHDWHTSLISVLLKTIYQGDDFYKNIATTLTIHNLANQGKTNPKILIKAGLKKYLNALKIGRFFSQVNFLRLGIENADQIVTVSPTYSKEILTKEYGEGLENVLRNRQNNLVGILNGIDTEVFNPATDPDIIATYSFQNFNNKINNKLALQKELGLEINSKSPLLGVISLD